MKKQAIAKQHRQSCYPYAQTDDKYEKAGRLGKGDVRPGCWYDCYIIQISKLAIVPRLLRLFARWTIKEVRQTDLRRRRIVSALLGRTTVSALLGVAAAVLLAVGLLSVKVASKKTDEEK